MKTQLVFGLLLCMACQASDSAPNEAASELPGSDFDGPAFEFERVSEDIFQARGTGNMTVGANATIVINADDVLVVDSHISHAAAEALMNELRSITEKPVRYVVNTHFHFDHAHGNQIYPDDVQIIGHEFTREMLANGGSVGRSYQGFQEALSSQPGYVEGQRGLVPTPPGTTLSERMTLFRGGREIRLLFFGRGHTGGDVVVHLPAERVLITGDLLLPGLPFMGDGFPVDWVETLEELKALAFDVVIPGHGRPFSDRDRIDDLQSYLRDLWERTSEAYSQGLTPDQAAERIDLSDHSATYASLAGPGVPLPAVVRIYELLESDGSNE